MIIYIAFGIVISVSIALIAMGLIEIDAEKKREITIDISNLPEEWIIEANRSKQEVTEPDGTIIRVGGVYIEGESGVEWVAPKESLRHLANISMDISSSDIEGEPNGTEV